MQREVAEAARLRGGLNDLIGLLTLPAIWSGQKPEAIARTLSDVVLRVLRPDFVYVRLNDVIPDDHVHAVGFAEPRNTDLPAHEFGRSIEPWVPADPGTKVVRIPNPIGRGTTSIVCVKLGLTENVGVVVIGSPRSDFPTDLELLLLRVAANQAETEIQRQRGEEREAQEYRRELAHLARVSALGELSGALAHELRQPLSAISANTQAAGRLLAHSRPKLADVRDILSDITQEVERAKDVIQRTSALVKNQETLKQQLDINDIVRSVLDLTRRELIQRGVSVSATLSPSLPAVLGDRVQLEQVLLNLVLNACDAMTAVPSEERELVLATSASDREVQLSVTDHGPGIPADSIDRVFQPFVTSKQHGLGLGLAISRSIVASHGGRLWAVNNPSRGVTFHMVTPRAP
jgi:signal transduction histidine kinase